LAVRIRKKQLTTLLDEGLMGMGGNKGPEGKGKEGCGKGFEKDPEKPTRASRWKGWKKSNRQSKKMPYVA